MDMSLAAQASVSELARRCMDETHKFHQRLLSEPQYCLELLRRALVDELGEALTHVFVIYERQVLSWVHAHSRFGETNESAEFFANAALSNFYFALRGERFLHFPSLQHVLAYLKTCVHSAIAQYLRDQRPAQTVSLSEMQEPTFEAPPDQLGVTEVWTHICALLPNQHDQQLARYAFLLGMKPRHIVALPAQPWQSEREISIRLYQIRQILRHDHVLRDLLGLADRTDQGGRS
jgi:hypothetical protein